jgi:hypothetical protein
MGQAAKSYITDEMRAILDKPMSRLTSYPIAASDIRKWAIAVYYPEIPPRLFWDEDYAATSRFGGIVAPEEFNPFAWMTRDPWATRPLSTGRSCRASGGRATPTGACDPVM